MNDLGPRQTAGTNFIRRKPRDATRELGAVHIANPHHIARGE